MISFLRGTLAFCDENTAVIDVNGVGYEVIMPSKEIAMLPRLGEETFVYTYLYLHEDVLALYAFSDKQSIKYFQKLIGVSGVGPKAATAVLSVLSPEELAAAVASSDAKAIAAAKGVGAKMAQRIVLELKGKIDLSETVLTERTYSPTADSSAVNALIALGCSPSEAQKTVMQISSEGMTTEDIIKEALRRL